MADGPLSLIVGHSNLDLDCIGSMVLARRLHPDHSPVKSGTIHPVAKNLYNLYETELEFLQVADVKGRDVASLVIVDTRSRNRIDEVLKAIDHGGADRIGSITIYDHHPADTNDFPQATVHGGEYGSTTTILGALLIDAGVTVTPDEATIALAGIYGDTGNFTHENVGRDDFLVASYLLDCGASLRLVADLTSSLRDEAQVELLHDALRSLDTRTMNGHTVARAVLKLPRQTPGIAAVAERLFEIEEVDALFLVVGFDRERATLIVARSRKDRIAVNAIMGEFGGGGHRKASSALVKDATTDDVVARLDDAIVRLAVPARTAREIMTSPVVTIEAGWSLLQAARFFEEINHTGAPVVDDAGSLVGFLTLRDIMKGRKADAMHAPVKGFMTRKVVTCDPDATIRDISHQLFSHNIGHLPVTADGKLIGIVTRSDYLKSIDAKADLGSATPR
ncbi:MAG: CBS domain-containing protein [Spirochaetaceae bacterium]|nr:MAG: CBS domain-containing protein [Spirochaetaceae bacterium]